MTNKKFKLAAMSLATAVAVSAVGPSASAVTYQLEKGDVTVGQDGTGAYSYQNQTDGKTDNVYVDQDTQNNGQIIITLLSSYCEPFCVKSGNTVVITLAQKGSQYELRSEMEEEAFDFINKMQDNGLELSDPYLESYIYGLIAKIAPESLVDGRPCNVNLLIVQQPNPISLIYPNGTIVLSTVSVGENPTSRS